MQLGRGFLGPDLRRLAQQNRPGIKPRFHLHDADPGFRIPRHDRTMNRCRPAPARQKARVDIETALLRCVENRLRQDQPISHDNRHIRAQRSKLRLRLFAFERHRIAHLKTERLGPRMNRCRALFLAASRRAGRLAIDGGNLMPRLHKRIQNRNGELGRAHENDPHSLAPYRAFCARLRSIARFVRLRWSKYILPLRWSI